jgi:uncharacterized protein (DUF58 family)
MAIGRTFWVIFALLVICLTIPSLPGIRGHDNEVQLFYHISMLWSLLIIASWVWTYLSLRRIDIRRHARTLRQQVGQVFEERFEVINLTRIARLWVDIRNRSDLPGAGGSRVLTWIGGGQSRSYLAYTMLYDRGQFLLGPSELISGDIFGLFTVKKTFISNTNLLVVPYMVDLATFPAPRGMLAGGRALRRRTLEVTPYAVGVREYSPGDPLKSIHWASTARRERLMVKEFEQDPHADVWVIVDAQEKVQASLASGKPQFKNDPIWWTHRQVEVIIPPSTIEYAVSIAASVANYYIHQGWEVGLACAGKAQTIIAAEKSDRQMGKILESLALLRAEGNLPLLGLVTVQAANIPRGSTVVLITSSTEKGVILAASDLIQRRLQPVVILIDPETFGGQAGMQEIQEGLASQGVAVIRVCKGDNLKMVLEGKSWSEGFSDRIWWKES